MDTEETVGLLLIGGIIVYVYADKIDKINSFFTLWNFVIIFLIIFVIFAIYFVSRWAFHFILRQRCAKERQSEPSIHKNLQNEVIEVEQKEVKPESNIEEQEKPSKNVAMAKPKRQRSVKINVDDDVNFYRHRKLNVDEIKYLIYKGHKQIKCLDIQEHTENFLIKQRANEGIEHCFLVYNIAEYLKGKRIKFELFNSVKPDIEFVIDGKKGALEIETGKVFKKNKKRFFEKINSLNKYYGSNWFFVVTDWNLAPLYSKYGKTLTKRNFIKKFEKYLKNQKNA